MTRLYVPRASALSSIPDIVRRAAMLSGYPTPHPDVYVVIGGTCGHVVRLDHERRRWLCDCEASRFSRRCSHAAVAHALRYPDSDVAKQILQVRDYVEEGPHGAEAAA